MFHSPASPNAARGRGATGGRARVLPRVARVAALSAVPLAIGVWVALPAARLAEVDALLRNSRAWLRATTGLFADPQVTQTTPAPAPPPASAPPPTAPASVADVASEVPLAYGDHLKITFYERVAVALPEPGAGPSVATIYPRLDLSGAYVVDADGRLSIPRVGGFAVVGVPIARVQAAIEAAFARSFGRPITAHIAVAERAPVYVLGRVRGAGSFAWRPGMTVLQALGAAGGLAGAATADSSAAIERIREGQRLHEAEVTIARLLIAAARLAALRADEARLALPPATRDRLKHLVSPAQAAAMIAGAEATLAIERAGFHQQRALAERQITVTRAGLAAQAMRVTQLDDLIEKRSLRLGALQRIATHGSVARFKLTDQAAEIAAIVARREDAHASTVQAERQVVEAEIALARIDQQHGISIDREAASVRQQIDDATSRAAAMRAVIAVLAPAPPTRGARPSGAVAYTITRRTPSGPRVAPAAADSVLQPGDVVEIGFDDAPATRFSHVQN